MKIKNNLKLRDYQVYIEESLEKVVALIESQTKKGSIAGVVEFNKMIRRENFREINSQVYNPILVGKNVQKTQISIKVQILLGVRDLVQAQK